MSNFWSNKVKIIQPYVPGEQPQEKNLIKLNTNENPYPPSPKVAQAIQVFNTEKLRLYPDPQGTVLKKIIADTYAVSQENVFLGNGSDEVLALAFPAFFNPGEVVRIPEISYSFYPVYCQVNDILLDPIPLHADFSIPVQAFLNGSRGVVIANPNAPTGRGMPLAGIEEILVANEKNVVIIDEAYIDFGGSSAIHLTKKYKNLLVVHTLSKSRSLAGLRMGYAIGDEALVEALERLKNSFNSYTLDSLALTAAAAAMLDTPYYQEISARIIRTREDFVQKMLALEFEVVPSQANFVFVKHPEKEASELCLALRNRKILVRHFQSPKIYNYLRITIGTPEEMQAVVMALKEILRD